MNQWSILIIVTGILLILSEIGFRFGNSAKQKNPQADVNNGSTQGAVLGLLGLLLGFSFAMAVGRYDNRRSLGVDEANAIGTTWLRTDLLTESRSRKAKKLLRQYTELRLESIEKSTDLDRMKSLVMESSKIQNELWQIAMDSAVEKPGPVIMGFINSLNEMIDLQTSRIAAARNHVPAAVWILLIVVAGCGAWASGFSSGTTQQRSAFNQIVFPVLVGIVVTLISDIDRPRKGLVALSHEPLRELYESMQP
ncbi:hypothetical protein JIN85_00725 [Luteolibacter pohnpeiensis]|uniref:DUF4239 domain-containing protein n=1 Tax=Luteolibacter pohnpeiensis TaxID=454153 RepID=A0A934S7R3_9BACT|nr:hypothetical protein [Luteolibacter pohnpeiensis]MBK1880914.1 hypothetical protein [Luteolibacter pohnpeiensis]